MAILRGKPDTATTPAAVTGGGGAEISLSVSDTPVHHARYELLREWLRVRVLPLRQWMLQMQQARRRERRSRRGLYAASPPLPSHLGGYQRIRYKVIGSQQQPLANEVGPRSWTTKLDHELGHEESDDQRAQPHVEPQPPPDVGAEATGADDPPAEAPTLANTDSSRTALSWPAGHDAGSLDSAIERRTSKVSSQDLQRNS